MNENPPFSTTPPTFGQLAAHFAGNPYPMGARIPSNDVVLAIAEYPHRADPEQLNTRIALATSAEEAGSVAGSVAHKLSSNAVVAYEKATNEQAQVFHEGQYYDVTRIEAKRNGDPDWLHADSPILILVETRSKWASSRVFDPNAAGRGRDPRTLTGNE